MNKQRMAAIVKLTEQLQDLRGELDTLATEESDYYNNMPESLQSSERGQQADEYCEQLGEARDNLESALDILMEFE